MAIATSGIKTHIWNNNLRALLFFLMYPILISPLYITICGLFFLIIIDATDATSEKASSYFEMAKALALEYFYVPYLILLAGIIILYLVSHNRLDIPKNSTTVWRENNPKLYGILENLCISRGLRMPYFFIQQYAAPNAYTFGISKKTFSVVVTSGLLNKLSDEEIEVVLAHELAHIINRDTRLLFLIDGISNAFNFIKKLLLQTNDYKKDAYYLIFSLASSGNLFIRAFVSRKREFIADAIAIELTKNPKALISSLQKLDGSLNHTNFEEKLKNSLFYYSQKNSTFSTHPSVQDRINAIEKISFMQNDKEDSNTIAVASAESAPISQNNVSW